MLGRMTKNDDGEFGVHVIKPRAGGKVQGTFKAEEIQQEAKREATESVMSFETLPEKLAHSRLYIRNHTVKVLKDSFPTDTSMWHVDLMYPQASGSPLYIDEPEFEYNIKQCERKRAVMKKAGLRYVILKKDTKFDEAILQLEGKL